MSRDKKKPTAWRCRSIQQQKDKQEIYNSREWWELRRLKMQANPLCERCIREGEAAGVKGGYITSAECVHHKHPIEESSSKQEMQHWAFMWSNLESLCKACHAKTHEEMKSKSKENVIHRRQLRNDRWAEAIEAKFLQPKRPEQATEGDPPPT